MGFKFLINARHAPIDSYFFTQSSVKLCTMAIGKRFLVNYINTFDNFLFIQEVFDDVYRE